MWYVWITQLPMRAPEVDLWVDYPYRPERTERFWHSLDDIVFC